MNPGFWKSIDSLLASGEVVIDRPKGSAHPRYPDLVYPLDYGYLKGSTGGDGQPVDVWVGSQVPRHADAVLCTIDTLKRDAEVKILLGCTEEEKTLVTDFLNRSESMSAVRVARPSSDAEQDADSGSPRRRTNRMYDEFTYLWPLISPPEDYVNEALQWRDALRAKLGPGRHEILELGVGGGCNLSHLTGEFQATAVDRSEKMLRNSVRLNPGVEHHVGDMRTVRLGRKFKAVIIHDAIDYLLTEEDLRQTFATAAAHLDPGGVFVTAPDWYRETFHSPYVNQGTNSDGRTDFTLVEYAHDPDPSDTAIESEMFYMIRESGKLRIERDLHVFGLFPLQTWLRLIDEAGFEVEKRRYDVHEDKREAYLLVGVRR